MSNEAVGNSFNHMSLAPANVSSNPSRLVEMAISKDVDVEKLQRLLNMQQQWEARQSEQEFARAFSAFQAELRPVPKEFKSKGHNSKYAPLDVLVSHCAPLLTKHGFNWRWEFADSPDEMRVTCVLSHVNGCERRNSMSAAPDDSGGKNKIQARASANSYLERYTFVGVTGVTVEGEDNDGGRPAVTVDKLLTHNAVVRENLPTILCVKEALATGEDQWSVAIEALYELDDETRATLWLAPSKGGMFTTSEKQIMKSDAFAARRREWFGEEQPK